MVLLRALRPDLAPPASTPPCLWPTRCPSSEATWLRSSPNTSPGLSQGLDTPRRMQSLRSLPLRVSVPSGSESLRRVRRGEHHAQRRRLRQLV